MENDVDYLLLGLDKCGANSPCIVARDGKCCRILKREYFPNESGEIVFERDNFWINTGFSAWEMRETLKMYKDSIKSIRFEDFEGGVHGMLNSGMSMMGSEEVCMILVGDGESSITSQLKL